MELLLLDGEKSIGLFKCLMKIKTESVKMMEGKQKSGANPPFIVNGACPGNNDRLVPTTRPKLIQKLRILVT